jgi:uncharacterized membrane protein YraQ (UPF0718 family)
MGTGVGTAVVAREPVRLPRWAVGCAFWLLVGAVIVARWTGIAEVPVVTTLGVIFTSIVIEALPFILIGALVSAAIAVWVPESAFARIARLPRALQVPGAAVAGVGFPVCECGSVPVARRLIVRGIDPAAGVAFMLAAPILNPIVLASTWVAYEGRGKALEMTVARAGLGLLVAIAVGWLIAHRSELPLLRGASDDQEPGHGHGAARDQGLGAFGRHLAGDFFFMGKFLVLGAAVAALIQTALPQSFVSDVGSTPVLSALTMVGIAFALSLCSEADAFVAVSFTAFPLGSQLAFLTAGPMLDTKLAVLYGATFRRDFTLRLALIAVPIVVGGALLFDALI